MLKSQKHLVVSKILANFAISKLENKTLETI